jgi:hypothetical protein
MSTRRLSNFIDDLVAGRRPRGFQADAEEREILRAAIALRGQRPGDSAPDQTFVASLQNDLAELSEGPHATVLPVRRWQKGRVAMLSVAAAVALVAGTAAITDTATQGTAQQSALAVPHGQALLTATFETSTGKVMGQIVVYHGHPSWVFMNVDVPFASGSMRCALHLANGQVVAAGNVVLHQGRGEIARNIQLDPGQLRNATLSDSRGVVLASASFV